VIVFYTTPVDATGHAGIGFLVRDVEIVGGSARHRLGGTSRVIG
jgi:hypothetical protein